MSKVFNNLHVHLVWATAKRAPILDNDAQAWMWPALAEKAKKLGNSWVVVGGMPDHVHVLTEFSTNYAIADLVRHLKGASVRVAHLRGLVDFAWQEGYGAFAVSRWDVERIEAYIRRQREHHQSFELIEDLELQAESIP